MPLEAEHQAELLAVARAAIADVLQPDAAAANTLRQAAAELAKPGASFVTVTTGGRLRGCCGSLRPDRPLARDVWNNARRSAFNDPRFAALTLDDVEVSMLEIAVLGALHPMSVTSEANLLSALRPGVDGLLMSLGTRRAVFLHKVWTTLPEPEKFVAHLKRKLGVPEDFWDDGLVFQRYRTQEFVGPLVER